VRSGPLGTSSTGIPDSDLNAAAILYEQVSDDSHIAIRVLPKSVLSTTIRPIRRTIRFDVTEGHPAYEAVRRFMLYGAPVEKVPAVTLEAAMGFTPTGTGSVCFRATEGRAFHQIEAEVRELLAMDADAAPVEVTTDSYGFTWLVCKHDPDDMSGLVTGLVLFHPSGVKAVCMAAEI